MFLAYISSLSSVGVQKLVFMALSQVESGWLNDVFVSNGILNWQLRCYRTALVRRGFYK